jgi:hypothetical protein
MERYTFEQAAQWLNERFHSPNWRLLPDSDKYMAASSLLAETGWTLQEFDQEETRRQTGAK